MTSVMRLANKTFTAACRACRGGPSIDNRGMKVLIDNGVLLGGCVLLALLVGRAETAVVIWLIAAVAVAGLGVTVKQGRWTVAVPAAYLLVGSFSTASVVGAPLASGRSGPATRGWWRLSAVSLSWPSWPDGSRVRQSWPSLWRSARSRLSLRCAPSRRRRCG